MVQPVASGNGTFAESVSTVRKELGMTRGTFATLVGCSENSVARWEAGTGLPQPRYRGPITNIIRGVTEDKFFTVPKTIKKPTTPPAPTPEQEMYPPRPKETPQQIVNKDIRVQNFPPLFERLVTESMNTIIAGRIQAKLDIQPSAVATLAVSMAKSVMKLMDVEDKKT